jgi:hypothetical protein
MTKILLISGDLMAASQIAGLARAANADVETRSTLPADSGELAADLVLLDMQSLKDPPDLIVSRTRQLVAPPPGAHPPRIVAFGPHVWKERLAAAVAAGADAAVSRGELFGGFPALVQRWTGG